MWVGWDFIYNNDIGQLITECRAEFKKELKIMQVINISGPPSSGKTSIIIKTW